MNILYLNADLLKPEDFRLSKDLPFFMSGNCVKGNPRVTYTTVCKCQNFSVSPMLSNMFPMPDDTWIEGLSSITTSLWWGYWSFSSFPPPDLPLGGTYWDDDDDDQNYISTLKVAKVGLQHHAHVFKLQHENYNVDLWLSDFFADGAILSTSIGRHSPPQSPRNDCFQQTAFRWNAY